VSDRVDGDLLAALLRARELDDRVVNFRRTGQGTARLAHADLANRYLMDLEQRAAAGEIDPKTVDRYRGALAHYLSFVTSGEQGSRVNSVLKVDRTFQLQLTAFLRALEVTANGRARGSRRPMVRADYVLDVVRAMYCWAADPQRGNLLGDGFVNPFLRRPGTRQPERRDPTAEPAITTEMAAEFMTACDEWQLPVFSSLLLWGLRPSELGWLFADDLQDGWIHVRCHAEFDYLTKGRRDKRVPILAEHSDLWPPAKGPFVLTRRKLDRFRWSDRASLLTEFDRRAGRGPSVRERREMRDRLFLDAGGLGYDRVENEFHRVAAKLGWRPDATLKGFRHLFATSLENGGMPEFYRRYLLGQSLGRSAIVTYTHLNQLRQQYERTVAGELAQVCEAISQRRQQLSLQ
jgi:integrase